MYARLVLRVLLIYHTFCLSGLHVLESFRRFSCLYRSSHHYAMYSHFPEPCFISKLPSRVQRSRESSLANVLFRIKDGP